MEKKSFNMIVIGGSAGCLEVIVYILKSLPASFQTPVVLVIHRMKNRTSRLDKLLSKDAGVQNIIEPEDKEPIQPGKVYLAPQNYHLLVEDDHTFSLDYSEQVNFSRPSIDVSFESIANVFQSKTLAILLSGANKDGASGLAKVIEKGGSAIIQSPDTAQYTTMPLAAIDINSSALVQNPDEIINCILHNPIN